MSEERGAEREAEPPSEASLYFVYVLHNAAGVLYTGIAKDVDARLRQHNSGSGARFTRGRGPWTVCHREGPLGHGDALRREAAIKIDRMFKAVLRQRVAPALGGKGAPKTIPARPRTKPRPQKRADRVHPVRGPAKQRAI